MYGRTKTNMESYATLLYERGHAAVFGNAHFHHPWFVRNVLCADGRRRTAYANNDATQYRVNINDMWHYGTIVNVEVMDQDDLYFEGSSTFRKIVHGYVVRYWMEKHDQSKQVDLDVLGILNACTRQTGIELNADRVILRINGKVKDMVQTPRWLQRIRVHMIVLPDTTWGDLVECMTEEGVR